MKVFKEWALQGRSKPKNPQITIFHSWFEQEVSARGWRGAFETILKKMNENKFMDNGELRTFIEQELEGK